MTAAEEVLMSIFDGAMDKEVMAQSKVMRCVFGLLDALVKDKNDWDGSCGKAFFDLLAAAKDTSDIVYKDTGITERMMIVGTIKTLEAQFLEG